MFFKNQVKNFSNSYALDSVLILFTSLVTGRQIRGGKGYFSIDFLEFSIEN